MSLTTAGLARLISHLLTQASWARARLSPFSGSTVRCHIAPIDLRFLIDSNGLLVEAPASDSAADVTISIPLSQLPTAALGDSNALINAVTLAGNAELADAVGFVFRNLEWDAEDDLARVVGNLPAHRIAQSAKALKQSHERAARAVSGNVVEYLTEEQGVLLARNALNTFNDEVRNLRDDIARLEKRTDRVAAKSFVTFRSYTGKR